MKASFLFIAALAIWLPANAQLSFKSTIGKSIDIKYRFWTTETGLPHWNIKRIHPGRLGLVWVQTGPYLSTFNGKEFDILDTINAAPLELSVSIAEDGQGLLWRAVGHQKKENSKILVSDWCRKTTKPLAESRIANAPDLGSSVDVYSLGEEVFIHDRSHRTIWRYNGQWEQAMSPNEAAGGAPGTSLLLPGPDNTWWHLDKRKAELLTAKGHTQAQFPKQLAADDKWYWENGQLYYYSTDPEHPFFLAPRPLFTWASRPSCSNSLALPPFPRLGHLAYFPELEITLFTKNMGGANTNYPLIYSHTDGRIVDFIAALLQEIGQKRDPSYQMIADGFLRLDGNTVLINLANSGLLQVELTRTKFQTLADPTSIRCLEVAPNGSILATTRRSADRLLELRTGARIHARKKQQHKTARDHILFTHQGEVWAGRYGPASDLVALDQNLEPIEANRYPLAEWEIPFTVESLSADKILLGSSKGLSVIDFSTGDRQSVLRAATGLHIHRDQAEDLWCGTNRGLFHLPSGKMYLDSIQGQPVRIAHIYEDHTGNFWLSTFHGLIKWRPFSATYQVYNQKNGLISEQLHAAYPDSLGRLWLSSNYGIMAFDTATYAVRNFTTADGLASNEHNHLAHAADSSGKLYFGSINGITAFDPNAIPNSRELKLQGLYINKIDALDQNGMVIDEVYPSPTPATSILIDNSCIQMMLRLSLPYFKSEQLNYAWRIRGYSPQWSSFNLNTGLNLSGLPHGEFVLEVKVSERNNPTVSRTFRFPFFKAYYPYQRVWFWAIVFLLLAAGVALIIRFRSAQLDARNAFLEKEVAEQSKDIRQQRDTILAQKQQLEQLDAAKTQLFNNISHEFRTPLSIIKGEAAHLGLQPMSLENQARIREKIDFQTVQLTHMLNDVMDLSKLQMGSVQCHPTLISWQPFIERVFTMFEGLAAKKQLAYRLDSSPLAPICLMADQQKIERILTNLISNAIKFTPEAGRILVQSRVDNQCAELIVSDTGPGIAPEEQETIFERYRQGTAALGQAHPGYGIGLALCREYALLMDAKLWVESLPGEGASFFLNIPVDIVKSKAPPTLNNGATLSPIQKRAPRTFSRLPTDQPPTGHILVVEDHPDLLEHLRDTLKTDYQISTATNGQEAWECLEADPTIDLVLSDVMMPVMDGLTLLQKTRKHQQLGFIPFLILTALTAPDDQLKALRLGVDGYIAKPFSKEELNVRVANAIARQQNRKTSLLTPSTPERRTSSSQAKEQPLAYDEKWLQELDSVTKSKLHNNNFKVPDLAHAMHISERTLYNRIQTYTGLSPSQYLRKARLEQAMIHLENRRYRTIKEVVHAVGMNNVRHFTILFKEEFGKLPKELAGK